MMHSIQKGYSEMTPLTTFLKPLFEVSLIIIENDTDCVILATLLTLSGF